MKNLFVFLAVILTTGLAYGSQQAEKTIKAKAVLKVCPATKENGPNGARLMPAPGCLNRIVLNNKEVVVVSGNGQAEKILGNIIGTNQFHGITKSLPFRVEGFFSKMKVMGYEREVFVVTDIVKSSVILPKGFH